MTRGYRFNCWSPTLRRRILLTCFAALTSAGTWAGIGEHGSIVSAQEAEIQQVVGKQLNGGTQSGKRTTTQRTNPPSLLSGLFGGGRSSSKSKESERKVTPITDQRQPADWAGIPYHAPAGRTAGQTAPIRDPRAGQSDAPAVPPRITKSIAGLPTPPALPTTQPRPISSNRETVADAKSKPSELASESVGSRPESLSDSRSSRRSTSSSSSSSPIATTTPSTQPKLLSPETPSRSTSEVVELVPKVARRVLKVETPTEEKSTKPAAVAATKPAVAPESSRRVETTDSAPSVATPSMPIAQAKPATTPATAAIVNTLPVNPPTPVQTPQPSLVQSTPSVVMGEARQSQSVRTETMLDSSVSSSSSRPQTAQTAPTTQMPQAGAEIQMPAMATFGGARPSNRATGSLAPPAAGGVALQPISDRLPFDNPPATGEGTTAWHDAEVASHDSFAPRASLANGPTTPPTNTATYGRSVSSNAGKGSFPNAMRGDSGSVPSTNSGTTIPSMTGSVQNGNDSSTVTSELPGIRIVTVGPRQVTIRQTHGYEIRAENRGSIDADGLLVRAHIPDWADVVGQQVTAGDVKATTEGSTRELNWRIDRLAAGETQRMFVRLKASRSGTHDLDVDWTLAPQKDVVQVHVQEPQLALTIDGPDEVIYGHSKTYRIRVLNPGDGIAPNVIFTLSPESSSPQSQRIGDIPAGQEAQFEVELTAQDLGELKIHGLAVGDLELRSQAAKTVRVLAADLEAVLTGPEVKYQNTEGTYQLELSNNGTAPSDEVMATLALPIGVKYIGGMEGAVLSDNQLRWKIASLTPGARRDYQFRVMMESTGTQEFAFDCKGTAAGQTNVALMTNVEAVADLVLSIDDPLAPAPIGEDVRYEIIIRNRGTKPATDVQAIAQFSNGIEPQQIVGHGGKVITGQVLIEPIARIDAGQEVRLTIVARAQEGGHHRFRTEVRSGDMVLVAEEATHYASPNNERISNRSGPGGNEFSLPLR